MDSDITEHQADIEKLKELSDALDQNTALEKAEQITTSYDEVRSYAQVNNTSYKLYILFIFGNYA